MTQTITKLHDGQQVQIKGTRPYAQDCKIGTLKGFYEKNPQFGDLTQAHIDNETAKGGSEFWINLSASVLTNDRAYNLEKCAEREASPHLQAGDIVEIEGRTFTIENTYNNNFKFVEIK